MARMFLYTTTSFNLYNKFSRRSYNVYIPMKRLLVGNLLGNPESVIWNGPPFVEDRKRQRKEAAVLAGEAAGRISKRTYL